MSARLIAIAWKASVSPTAKFVLLAIADLGGGNIFDMFEITTPTGLTSAEVDLAIAELQSNGLITVDGAGLHMTAAVERAG